MRAPSCRLNAGRHQAGLTLIELLLAMAIAVVIIGIAYSLYRTVSQVLRGQTERAQGAQTVDRALDQFRDDLAGVFLPEDDDECGFVLVPDAASTGETLSISFCTVRGTLTGPDKRWGDVLRVEYLRDAERLVRTERPLTGPRAMGPPLTNVLVEALAHFHVTVYDGEEWRATWPMTKAQQLPRASRVELANQQEADKRPAQSEFLIPAGLIFTGSIQRTTAQ